MRWNGAAGGIPEREEQGAISEMSVSLYPIACEYGRIRLANAQAFVVIWWRG